MIAKLLGGAAALCLAAPAIPQAINHNYNPAIVMVSCNEGSGTAFRVGPHRMLSVNHVTRMSGCTIGGKPFAISYASEKEDFSILQVSDEGPYLKINCGGIPEGAYVFGSGYAMAKPYQTIIMVQGTGEHARLGFRNTPMALLWGNRFIPGMSGGPILTMTGEVVGTVNAYDRSQPVSMGRELKDEPVCSH